MLKKQLLAAPVFGYANNVSQNASSFATMRLRLELPHISKQTKKKQEND